MKCLYCEANADAFGGVDCVIECEAYVLKDGWIGCRYNRATIHKRLNDKLRSVKPQTNADRIRAMTDEELAEFFFKDPFRAYMKTPKENLDWLKQESE